MNLEEFKATLSKPEPPDGIEGSLRALWLDAKGRWSEAHEAAQEEPDPTGAWVHAYLHRVEGDESNAGYWYDRAERSYCNLGLSDEWDQICSEILQASAPKDAGDSP